MTKPIARSAEDKLKEILWQNVALSQENRVLAGDLAKARERIQELEAKAAEPAKRSSIRP